MGTRVRKTDLRSNSGDGSGQLPLHGYPSSSPVPAGVGEVRDVRPLRGEGSPCGAYTEPKARSIQEQLRNSSENRLVAKWVFANAHQGVGLEMLPKRQHFALCIHRKTPTTVRRSAGRYDEDAPPRAGINLRDQVE